MFYTAVTINDARMSWSVALNTVACCAGQQDPKTQADAPHDQTCKVCFLN